MCAGGGKGGGGTLRFTEGGSCEGIGGFTPPEMIFVYSLGPAGSDEKFGAGLVPGGEKTRVAPSASCCEVNDGSESCKRFDVEDLRGTGLSAAESDSPRTVMGGHSVPPGATP